MNIQVRVIGAAARAQLKAIQAQIALMNGQTAAGTKANQSNTAATSANTIAKSRQAAAINTATGALGRYNAAIHMNSKSLNRWGNQLQWTGRQLQRNWTLPLALAAGAGVHWALENEKAFVHTRKVYGDFAAAQAWSLKNTEKWEKGATSAAQNVRMTFEAELNALEKAFEAISEQYGVNLKEVNEVSGAWAAAGFSGEALARSVDITMRAVKLGNMEAADATKALIAMQAQFDLSTEDLISTLYELNAVENQTGIDLAGLIEGFEKAAGVAKAAGIPTRELAAHMAALVPASGGARQAGNALKTIYSRLLATTGDTARILEEMGFQLDATAWKSATVGDRLKMLTERFSNMDDAQQAVAASVIGSRWQFNKLLILLGEIGKENGFYAKALNATQNETKIIAQAQDELNAILDSSPNKFDRVWQSIKNGMAGAAGPLIPILLSVMESIRSVVDAFQNLDPRWQKFIVYAGIALALMPFFVVYLGSLATLLGTVGTGLTFLAGGFFKASKSLGQFVGWALKAPFKFLIGGFTGVASAFGKMSSVVLGRLGLFSAATGALTAVHNVFWGGILKIWFAGYGALAATGTAFTGVLSNIWLGGFRRWLGIITAGMVAKNAVFMTGLAKMSRTLVLILGIMQATLSGWIVAMIGSLMAFGARMDLIFIAMWNNIKFGFLRLWQFLLVQATIFRAGLFAIWTQMHLGLTAITAAFSGAISKLWSLVYVRMLMIHTTLGGMLVKAWAVMHAGMAAISKTFWTTIIRMWIFGMATLIKSPAKILVAFKAAMKLLPRILLGPWGLLVAAVVGILYAFRDQIVNIWDRIVTYFSDSSNGMTRAVLNAWNALPQGVANALTAVARIVQKAALQIYEWFSYINPFAQHSPSLVDNVTNGMTVIEQQFARLGGIGNHLKGAYADIKAFGNAVASLLDGARTFEEAQERASIKAFAPGALDEYDQLSNRLHQLEGDLATIEGRMQAQENVVNSWQAALDRANNSLEIQEDKLTRLSVVADAWKQKLDEAQQSLDDFATAPIQGMRAANDAIFENEMAQKRLRLEMMKIEEVTGSLDDLKSKMDAIHGAQELLRGEQSSLRSAGAGSDILSHYDEEIKKLDDQKQAFEETAAPLNAMQQQLEELQRQAEIMDLEKSLKFDPLTRAIEQAANAMEELPFNTIMAGVQQSQIDVTRYSDAWEKANAAVEAQRGVVDRATVARDALQTRLDAERAKLDQIKEGYDLVRDAISSIEQAMQGVTSAADTMNRSMESARSAGREDASPALEAFRNAEGGNFPDVGGSGMPMRTNWDSQVAGIEEFTKQLEQETADMFSSLNPFGPIKEKWGEFSAWMKSRWTDFKAGFGDMFTAILGGDEGVTKAGETMTKVWDKAKVIGEKIWDALGKIWDLLGPEVKDSLGTIIQFFQDMWDEVGPELAKFGKLIKPTFEVFKKYVLPVLAVLGVALLGIVKVLWSMFNGAIKPVFSGIVSIIKGFWQVVRGIFELIIGVLTGDIGMALGGLKAIFVGTFNAIWGSIKAVIGGILGAIWGFIKGIWGFFVWLWDVLIGNSIIPDIINGIWEWFGKLISLGQWIWDNVLKPVWDFVKALWKDYVKPGLAAWWEGIKAVWNILKTLGQWVWNNVLKPVWDFVKALWKDYVKPGFQAWWEGIKTVWNVLKTLGQWVWNNVLKPVWDFVKALWKDWVKPGLLGWWEGIKSVWNNLKNLATWVWDNVLAPIKDKFVDAFVKIKDWFTRNKNIFKNPIRSIVNIAIDAVNAMIKGINKIADVLPGLDWEINLITRLAQGGEIPRRRVGAGFQTTGARAIVGEGKANHPEFVVPTDPSYRSRAIDLYKKLGEKLGVMDPSTPFGGFGLPNFDDIKSGIGKTLKGVKSAGAWLANNAQRGASLAFKPFKAMAENALENVGWRVPRGLGNYGLDQIDAWIKGADETFKKFNDSLGPPVVPGGSISAQGWTNPLPRGTYRVGGSIGSYPGHTGLDLAASMGTKIRAVSAGKVVSSYDLPGANPYNGTPYRSYGKLVIVGHNDGTSSYYAHMRDRAVTAGQVVKAGSLLGYVGMNGNATGPHLHLEIRKNGAILEPKSWLGMMGVGLESGGIVRRRAGGIFANIGEGSHDEAVVPLPHGWRNGIIGQPGSTKNEYHFHGDLSFPNVKNGDDAETFLDNLEILARR